MKRWLLALGLTLVGCIHEPARTLAIAPGTPPPSPALVSACKSERAWHNVLTIAAAVFGGAAGAEGSIDAVVTDHNTQVGIAVGAGASGVIGGVAAAISGMEADAYTNNNCPTVLSQVAPSAPP